MMSGSFKKNVMVAFTAIMLGIGNSLNDEEKMLSDFEEEHIMIEIKEESFSQIKHPNLLWDPRFYVESLMQKLIWWN